MKTDVVRVTELVIKYLRKELSETERTALSAWLSESTENQRLFDELTDEEALLRELRTALEPGMEASVEAYMAMKKAERLQLFNRIFRLSAAVGVTFLSLLFALPGGNSLPLNKPIDATPDMKYFHANTPSLGPIPIDTMNGLVWQTGNIHYECQGQTLFLR